MVAIIMGCVVVVTRGHVEEFWDDDSSPARDTEVTRNQFRTLLLAAVPFTALFVIYRDVVA